MVDTFEGDLENIVLRIVGDPQKGEPFRLDLIAKGKLGNFDLCARPHETF